MLTLVDTCGWIEWLTDGVLAESLQPRLNPITQVLVPTCIQFELYKWTRRELGEARALSAIALTEQAQVMPLSTSIALLAGDMALDHRLSFADALIYATARHCRAALVTCDHHFQGLDGVEFLRKPGA